MENFAEMLKVSIDSTFTRIGFGVYQRKVFALLCLAGISFSIIDSGPIFWAHSPQLHCSGGHDAKNLSLGAGHGNLSHALNNETFTVNLMLSITKSDELLTTISSENKTKFDESNSTTGNIFGKSNSLPAASVAVDYQDISVYQDTGHKCSISADEGLLIVYSGDTRQHCHDPTADYKISTIAARVSLIVCTKGLCRFFMLCCFCSGVGKKCQRNGSQF